MISTHYMWRKLFQAFIFYNVDDYGLQLTKTPMSDNLQQNQALAEVAICSNKLGVKTGRQDYSVFLFQAKQTEQLGGASVNNIWLKKTVFQ